MKKKNDCERNNWKNKVENVLTLISYFSSNKRAFKVKSKYRADFWKLF